MRREPAETGLPHRREAAPWRPRLLPRIVAAVAVGLGVLAGTAGPAPAQGTAGGAPAGSQIVPGAQPPPSQAPQNEAPANPPAASAPAVPLASPSAGAANGATRQEVLTLQDLGVNQPSIRLLGVQGEGSLPFSVRSDEKVVGGKVDLAFAYSPALIPQLSHLTVLLNGQVVQSVPLPKDKASGDTATLEIPPQLFRHDNRILFRFIGHYTLGCEDPLDKRLWLTLAYNSAITMQLQKLEVPNNLALLPTPFYDARDMQPLDLPFVFAAPPSPATLQAAGVVASWFGSLAAYKGATFPVSFDGVPKGNAVVFATEAEKPAGVPIPALTGPTISGVANPKNPETKLLLVMGRNEQELAAAAQTLALGATTLSGQTQVVGTPDIATRQPYDAPRWIPMDRPVRFGELVKPTDLQGHGLVPGLLTVNFRTAPDLFVWGSNGIPLDVRYRYPAGQWLALGDSRLDVSINNSYLRSLPLAHEDVVRQFKDAVSPAFVLNEQRLQVPPYYVFGQNQLQFYYELKPRERGHCQDVLPNNVQETIDPDSTIDLSGTDRFTTLPNLAFFVNSGYPFTKLADLSQTAVVIPDQPTPVDVETYLTLMGMMGDSTGFPVVRVSVVKAADVGKVADKDFIVLGAISRQPLVAKWGGKARLRVEGGRLRVAADSSFDRISGVFDPNADRERAHIDQLLAQQGGNLAAMIGMESPLGSGHTVVMITGSTPADQMTVLNTFRNRDLNPLIQGDLTVIAHNKVSSFRIGTEYTVGHLPVMTRIRWSFGNSPLLLIVCTLIGVLIIALVAYWILSRIAERRLAGRLAP